MQFFSKVFLPFLLLNYIAVETFLKLNHTSLCEATGCQLAGELLRFNPLYLNYFGIASVFFLTVLGYFSLKSKLAERLFLMVLYSAIAFEATILGYQFIANPEPCMFCLGIFSSLMLIALLNHFRNFPFILSVALSIFLGLNTIAITQNKSFISQEGTYLIQSKSCVHCKKVKEYLAKHQIKYIPISVQEASARSFLKFAGISTIPVLITKTSSHTSLIVGDTQIIAHYENKPTLSSTTNTTSSTQQSHATNSLSSSFLSAGSSDAGCAVSIVETPSCDKNTSKKP
jgi:glutaredoxin